MSPDAFDPSDREKSLARALADFIDLRAQGITVDAEAFTRRYPGLEDDLRAAIEALSNGDDTEGPHNEPVTDSSFPEELSGHRILSMVGAGGMALVFLAEDERLGRKVAVKALQPRYARNEQLRARFMHEARALARLNHPNIVRIYNLGKEDEPPHFVMEYLEGVPLTDAVRALTLHQKVDLVLKVVAAVQFLHDHRLIHRDLKPGNILVGSDLEPKLLDFGLARQADRLERQLTRDGEVMGTPDYFSPEQARGDAELDARSDIFSLGVILYEVLTAALPFRGETLAEQVQQLCGEEPVLPRRRNAAIPGDLQNVCMKALEKDPAQRYPTAREMAGDLARFLAGEPVLAAPSGYARRMSGGIEQHLRELDGWRQDRILSDYEYDALRKPYDRLVEREDAWIMEVRRLSLAQVALYLGAWLVVVGSALLFLFRYPSLAGTPIVLLVTAAAAPAAALGIRHWQAGRLRIAVAYLLAFCLLLPATLLVAMGEYGISAGLSRGREDLEFLLQFDSLKRTTNSQLWWALLLSLPAYLWLRRFTRSSVFSLVFSAMLALLCLATLLRLGMLEWWREDPGQIYLRLLPAATLFFTLGLILEFRRLPSDSRYFYPLAVFFTYVSLSGLALFHEPYAKWLDHVAPWTRGQVEYLFIINAGIYFVLQLVCERFHSTQMRNVAKAFRFVIPSHVLISLWLLGMEATRRWEESPASQSLRLEARTFELLLPAAAALFVLWSIPKQMKNYLATGMLFLAVGIVRLQQYWLRDNVYWPLALLAAGTLIMLLAPRYPATRVALARRLRRRP